MIVWSQNNGGASVPRADGVQMAHVAVMPSSGWLMTDAGPVPILSANINLASASGSQDLVAAVSGKILAVHSLILVGSGTSLAYFLDTAGNLIFAGSTAKVQLSTTPFILPANNHLWMRTAAGSALRLNLASSVTVGGVVQYVQL